MSRRIRRPPPGQPVSTAPSWAKDFLDAQDPKTSPARLSELRDLYQEAISQHQQRQAQSILSAVARNPNLNRDGLSWFSNTTQWCGDVACNPALAKLALEDAAWCKGALSRRLLKLAMPDLYEQVIEEEKERRAKWEAEREERRGAQVIRPDFGSRFTVPEYEEEEEDETENPRYGGPGDEEDDDGIPW